MGKQWLTLFFWAPKSLGMMIAAMTLEDQIGWHLESMMVLSHSVYKAGKGINVKANGLMVLQARVSRVRLEESDVQHINESLKLK